MQLLFPWNDLDPCTSTQSPEEPNFDAYVAALQLQDCDDSGSQHNNEDSDYKSDYFSD